MNFDATGESMIMIECAKYKVGQIVAHKQHHYRGVIIDIDPAYQPTGLWQLALSDHDFSYGQPWYRILVDESTQITYAPEQYIEEATNLTPIDNPNLRLFLKLNPHGVYESRFPLN